jgi:hypothetical protein
MKKFAGIAQLLERPGSLRRVLGENPAPRSTLLQAAAAGLQMDPATRDRGFADGMAGTWRLSADDILGDEIDVLAYATGFREATRRKRTN